MSQIAIYVYEEILEVVLQDFLHGLDEFFL